MLSLSYAAAPSGDGSTMMQLSKQDYEYFYMRVRQLEESARLSRITTTPSGLARGLRYFFWWCESRKMPCCMALERVDSVRYSSQEQESTSRHSIQATSSGGEPCPRILAAPSRDGSRHDRQAAAAVPRYVERDCRRYLSSAVAAGGSEFSVTENRKNIH
ncbi:hypothetical protein MPH_02786 [Macrophomina phaseolina MS6]|uniref:Uncharacterized protein n=1 Tax=Macrophomina phaseolina (strain MS6) TaxID=1126212 RepID=K2RZ00_MACPH|nr:hypothetical protein MPH_02786 [Macrophomina phaseolina MS6]